MLAFSHDPSINGRLSLIEQLLSAGRFVLGSMAVRRACLESSERDETKDWARNNRLSCWRVFGKVLTGMVLASELIAGCV